MIHPLAAFLFGVALTIVLIIFLVKLRDEKQLNLLKKYRKEFLEMREELKYFHREQSIEEFENRPRNRELELQDLLDSHERPYYRKRDR